MFELNKFNREKQQNNHIVGRRSFVRLMEMRDKMAANMSKLEPEKRTKEAAMTIFKEVLGQRLGYVRGLGKMVIPESSRQATDS
ncbi:hypothetical protein I3843_01G101700 [Carya illinoinensis]|nr:hypothetical protein I3843_01G101700 [Carya illinoinensis]